METEPPSVPQSVVGSVPIQGPLHSSVPREARGSWQGSVAADASLRCARASQAQGVIASN